MVNLKFTIVTVTFNAEKTIKRTIESVLNQSYLPYEYLIIDGRSTDETVEIAREYETQFKLNGIKYSVTSKQDTGIYNAMNRGIAAATGDFISFLNAGDWYQNDALYHVNNFYQEESFDLTYGGLNYINPNGSITTKLSKKDSFLVTSRHWNHPSMFLRRTIYQKYNFDESYPTYADFELYLKIRKKQEIKIRVIPEIITNFVADGVSTDVRIKKVLSRSKEKYMAYKNNGYAIFYWVESYGWEFVKSLYFRIRS